MSHYKESHISRRRFIKLTAGSLAGCYSLTNLYGCTTKEPIVRIASNVWPGYEFLYLAREKQYFEKHPIKLVELPSATVCIQSVAAGAVEGAMLTLDEVLTARAEGLDLRVIAVLDISIGADVVLAKPNIKTLSDLKGKRIGVEKSAVGAVMLHAVLNKSGLTISDINPKYMTVSTHKEAYLNNEVDALITFEPVKTQLEEKGAINLFDSSQISGRIVDVLAVHPSVIKNSPNTIKKIIQSHFMARDYYVKNQTKASAILAQRMHISPSQVPGSYDGLSLPDIDQNRHYLDGNNPALQTTAIELTEIMYQAGLLETKMVPHDLIDSSLLPQ